MGDRINLLALDPGTVTGYAYGSEGKVVECFTWDNTPIKKTEKRLGEPKHYRLLHLWHNLNLFCTSHPVDHIICEDAAAVYGKQIGATIETQNYAAEIRLRAERRLGEMLKDSPKQDGARGRSGGGTRGSKKEPQVNAPPTLSSIHISKKESSRSQE
ncbi:MAG: hypothetical protein NT096_01630 [Proteobacteria bacterium]|nr:hypothetical protein [Pseudomonadota bacterium]